jgi:ketosteroid isomerase-like protein
MLFHRGSKGMKNHLRNHFAGRTWRSAFLFLLTAGLFLAYTSPVGAQQKDKKKKKDAQPIDATPMIPMSDDAQIDYMISEMLGAWQIGDSEKMHKDYADDVTVVNGVWAPPVIGWSNYLAVYQQQRSRLQQVRLDRSNTYIKVNGTLAWACYQWDFSATVDGQPSASQGQTTLVLEKRNNHWVIVHNHTSLVLGPQSTAPAAAPAITQSQPTAGKQP